MQESCCFTTFNIVLFSVCAAGKYADANNNNQCTDCAVGTYSTTAGATTCTNCPAGSTTSAVGKTASTDCSKLTK